MPQGYSLPAGTTDDDPWHCWNDARPSVAAAGCSAPQEADNAAAAGVAYDSCPGFVAAGQAPGQEANVAHFSSILAANASRQELWRSSEAGSRFRPSLLVWLAGEVRPGALVGGAAIPRDVAKDLPADYGARAV